MTKLWKPDEPIIQHMMQDDVYKRTMGNFIRQFFPNVRVTWQMIVRSDKIRLADYIDEVELREQLAHAETLEHTAEDIAEFDSWGIFPPSYTKYLRTYRLSPIYVRVSRQTGDFVIEADGPWLESSGWEMKALPIAQTLYAKGFVKKHGLSEADLVNEGDRRLTEKIEVLQKNPQVKFAAFWMRRALSTWWDDHVTERMVTEAPDNIVGISNMHLAKKYGREATGTRAHELDMVVTALRRLENDELVRLVPYEIMQKWRMTYGHRLLIMLGDTYGTGPFLERLPPELARVYRGFRLDSGDPFEEARKYLVYYEKHGIDASEKLAIPSDSLTVPLMIELERVLRGMVRMSFGLGTNISHDFGAFGPLPAVMKPVEAAGHPVVKLSNNLAKGTGDAKERAHIAKLYGYDESFDEAVQY